MWRALWDGPRKGRLPGADAGPGTPGFERTQTALRQLRTAVATGELDQAEVGLVRPVLTPDHARDAEPAIGEPVLAVHGLSEEPGCHPQHAVAGKYGVLRITGHDTHRKIRNRLRHVRRHRERGGIGIWLEQVWPFGAPRGSFGQHSAP